MTDIEKLSDLMSKVDAACVFARSKSMKGLLKSLKHPGGTIQGVLLTITVAIGGFALGGIAAGFEWLPSEIAAAVSASFVFGAPIAYVTIKTLQAERYNKQATAAGVWAMKDADQPATAVTKMRIIDAYEALNISSKQLALLKSLAQRNDIPAGWWESAAQLLEQYKEEQLESARQQKANEDARAAEQRLAALSNVSVEPGYVNILEQQSVAKPPEGHRRFLL